MTDKTIITPGELEAVRQGLIERRWDLIKISTITPGEDEEVKKVFFEDLNSEIFMIEICKGIKKHYSLESVDDFFIKCVEVLYDVWDGYLHMVCSPVDVAAAIPNLIKLDEFGKPAYIDDLLCENESELYAFAKKSEESFARLPLMEQDKICGEFLYEYFVKQK